VVPGSIGRLHPGRQAWRLSLKLRATSAQSLLGCPPALLFQIQALLASSLGKMTTGENRLHSGSCAMSLVKPKVPAQAHQPALLGHAIMPCRAMPRHASSQKPEASSQLSSRHTTRSRELGPTILVCPLVKIQEQALQGKHKLGCQAWDCPCP
jgi:hypothetical protein